jgi:dTDP-glucose pyrophosphorylase
MKKTITILALMLMAIHILNAQWVDLGTNTHPLNANNIIYSVVTDASGNVYAAGKFSYGDSAVQNYYVAKWTGDSAWVPLDTAGYKFNSYIYSLATDAAGNIYAAGAFTDDTVILNGNYAIYFYGNVFVAKYDGTRWTELGAHGVAPVPNVYGTAITTIAPDASGNVYAAGEFKDAGHYYYVSKWNGTAWAELGTGSNALNANNFISTIATDQHGNVYAAGDFTDTTGARYVAMWNGTNWSELGTGSNALNAVSVIHTITTDLTGTVYVGYQDSALNFYVAEWNGTGWAHVGTGSNALNANNSINTLTTDASGNLYAAGNFTDANVTQYVAKWNGTIWSELGTGANILDPNGYILSVATDAAMNVYAAGYFTDGESKYYVAEYDPNTQTSGIRGINSAHLKVYPNPATDAFDISILHEPESDYHVTLCDLAGRVVVEKDFTGASVTMRRGETDAGSYFIQVTDARTSNTFQKRIIFE